jgi:hypothetical protein
LKIHKFFFIIFGTKDSSNILELFLNNLKTNGWDRCRLVVTGNGEAAQSFCYVFNSDTFDWFHMKLNGIRTDAYFSVKRF